MANSPTRSEWAQGWRVPAIGLLGMTGPAAFSYASGVFMEDVTREFGWSRTQYASALMLQMAVTVVAGPIAGRLLDKIGPRPFVLAGIVPFVAGFSLFGLSNGSIALWCIFSVLLGCLSIGVGPAGWVAGTVRTFDVSRGLALGTVLAGTGLASAIWPVLAAAAAKAVGWKLAFPLLGLCWGLAILPLAFLGFRPKELSARNERASPPGRAASAISTVFQDRVFWCLLIAGCLFVIVNMSTIITFVPILRSQGIGLGSAAALAGIVGIFSVIGRIVTGFLLDRLPARSLVLVSFSLPLVVLCLLISRPGEPTALAIAAAFLGYGAGAEMDVVSYLCSRRFDASAFGTAFSSLLAGFAIAAGLGPMIAGRIYDVFGSYQPYLIGGIPIIVCAVLFAQLSFPRNPSTEQVHV